MPTTRSPRSRKPVQYPKTKEPEPEVGVMMHDVKKLDEGARLDTPDYEAEDREAGSLADAVRAVAPGGPVQTLPSGVDPTSSVPDGLGHSIVKEQARPDQVPALRPAMPTDAAGTFALATMSDTEFSERLATLKRGRDRIAQIQRELMEVDVDYGLIPGTPKPTLFKPGAEKLALIYGLAADLQNTFVPGDGETQPPLKYESACFLHLGSFDGPIVAVGHGTANGWEKRYRRESDKACPNCGATAIIKSKAEFGGGWYCFPKKGGCGSKFAADDEQLSGQATDPRGDPVLANDLQNTLLKMSEKRAFVDAVLRATASSSLFTQDVAEEPVVDNIDSPPSAARRADSSYVDEPEPEVRTADVGEVQRGGHRPDVTEAQIESARTLARSLKLTPWQVADEIAEVLQGGIDSTALSEDKAKAGAELLAFMKAMHPDDMGKVITHLRKMASA